MNPTYVRGILCTRGNFLSNSSLDFMDHRAWSGYLCYNGESNYTINSKLSSLSYDIIGCLGDTTVNDRDVLIHGEIYGDYKHIIEQIINSTTVSNLKSLLEKLFTFDGSYCMVIRGKLGTICCRDPLGTKPLYIGT